MLTTGTGNETDEDEKIATKHLKISIPDAEMKRPEADAKQCGRASTNGKYLNLYEIDQLADMIPPGVLTQRTEFRTSIWDSNLFLLLFFIPIVIEWILRKKYNMA